MNKEYRFLDKDGQHLHQLLIDGKFRNLTGCTTVLNVLFKPLAWWASGMACGKLGWIQKYVKYGDGKKIWVSKEDRLKSAKNGLKALMLLDVDGYLGLLDEAYKAHSVKKEKAGDYGKKTHNTISELVLEAIKSNKGFIEPQKHKEKSVQNFIDWAVKNRVKFLESEIHVYSKTHFLGGIVDIVCEIDERLWLIDIKTSKSGIYPSHFWQCGGYDIMLYECSKYKDIVGYIILNLKESGIILEKRSISNNDNKKAFMHCLGIYRLQEKIKNNII